MQLWLPNMFTQLHSTQKIIFKRFFLKRRMSHYPTSKHQCTSTAPQFDSQSKQSSMRLFSKELKNKANVNKIPILLQSKVGAGLTF